MIHGEVEGGSLGGWGAGKGGGVWGATPTAAIGVVPIAVGSLRSTLMVCLCSPQGRGGCCDALSVWGHRVPFAVTLCPQGHWGQVRPCPCGDPVSLLTSPCALGDKWSCARVGAPCSLPHPPVPFGSWGTRGAVPVWDPTSPSPSPCAFGDMGGQEGLCPRGALCPLLHHPAPLRNT